MKKKWRHIEHDIFPIGGNILGNHDDDDDHDHDHDHDNDHHQVVGSRPAPSIYWWLAGEPLAQAATQVDGQHHHRHHHGHRDDHHFHHPDLPLWKSHREHR